MPKVLLDLCLVTFGILSIGLVFVVYGSIAKTKWGINLERVACPRCTTPAPFVRIPNSRQQAMWGGYTCQTCGTELDKWGGEIPTERHCDRATPLPEK
jgi:hypothetical protein